MPSLPRDTTEALQVGHSYRSRIAFNVADLRGLPDTAQMARTQPNAAKNLTSNVAIRLTL
jgi:hypothetical protein